MPDCSLDAGLLARRKYPEGPATGHLDTGFSWFPCVHKRMLRWFPSFQVATACFSCSPPDLNFLVTFFSYLFTCKITTASGWHPIAVNKYYYYKKYYTRKEETVWYNYFHCQMAPFLLVIVIPEKQRVKSTVLRTWSSQLILWNSEYYFVQE